MSIEWKSEKFMEKSETIYYCRSLSRRILLADIKNILDRTSKSSVVNIEFDIGLGREVETALVTIKDEKVLHKDLGKQVRL